MAENNEIKVNDSNIDSNENQLSDEDLNAVNGGLGIPKFIKKAAKKAAKKVINEAKETQESLDYLRKRF